MFQTINNKNINIKNKCSKVLMIKIDESRQKKNKLIYVLFSPGKWHDKVLSNQRRQSQIERKDL